MNKKDLTKEIVQKQVVVLTSDVLLSLFERLIMLESKVEELKKLITKNEEGLTEMVGNYIPIIIDENFIKSKVFSGDGYEKTVLIKYAGENNE